MEPSVDSAACSTLSRRSFFRFAAGASALASMPILTEAHLAMAQRPHFSDPNKGIHIDANENPLGPSDAARQAMIDIVPRGGRYLMNMEMEIAEIFAKQEGLTPDCVRVYAGSSEPLHYSVLAFADKNRPLVVADPGYEAPMWAANGAGYPVKKVALADPKGAATHDIKAMLAASSNPGVIYICNPNNPTGTCTPRADIEYAVSNAPKDTILLIDEAYVHLCDEPRSIDFVKEGKNVIVLRTFSIGIGGSLTAPPLPHHRTCGSASGGSDGLSYGSSEQPWKPKRVEVGDGERIAEGAAVGHVPRAMSTPGCFRSQVFVHSQRT
jgi:histidinol-phosphate aminotransferase